MKKLKRISKLLAIGLVVVFASSCRDEFTEEQAIELQGEASASALTLENDLEKELILLQDSLRRIGGIIHYTVSVVDAGNAVFSSGEAAQGGRLKQTQAVSGAVVTTTQNGIIASATTGADGLAVFDDMRIGNVAVNIAVADFTDVNFMADITPKGNATSPDSESSQTTDLYNFTRNSATQVPVFPTTGANTATISGRVTIETDLTNATPEFPAAASVIALIDVDNSDFINTFIEPEGQSSSTYGNQDYAGRILRISYDDASVSGAVDPATGAYSITVPASAAGLPMAVLTSDVIENQTLYLDELNGATLNDVATLRTLFGPGVRDGSTGYGYYNGYCLPSQFPEMLDAATVTFSAPTGATGSVITDVAEGNAVLGMTGTVESITVTSAGKFSQAPFVQINGVGSGASATANVSTMGEVTSITVVAAGQNYGPGAAYMDSNSDGFHDNPDETTVQLLHGGDDAVVDVDLLAGVLISDDVDFPEENRYPTPGAGDDYSTFPTPTFTNTGTGAGTGLAGTFFGSVSFNSSLIDGGSGYIAKYLVDPDGVESNGIGGSAAQEGRISGPELLVSAPDDVNFSDVNADDDFDGTDDRADGYTIVEGAITAIALSDEAITNNTNKYYIDPTDIPGTTPRLIVGPNRGATASATMSTSDGEVSFVNITNGGTGYTFPPVASISGNASIAVANGGMGIEAIAFTNGNGYVFTDVGGSDVLFDGGGADVSFGLGTVVTDAYNLSLPTTTGGYDLVNPPVWTDISGNGTTDAVITGIVADDGFGSIELTGFTITTAGAGYTGDPNFNNLTAGVDPSFGAIFPIGTFDVATYTINNSGNYNTPPFILAVSTPSHPAGVAVLIGAITLQVEFVAVINTGSGYDFSAANAITFSSGGGTGAAAEAGISTSIDAVTVNTGGTYFAGLDLLQVWVEGYSNFTDAGYARSADTDGDGFDDFFGDIDHLAQVWVTGEIEEVRMDNGGDGYSAPPTFTPTDPTDPAAPGSGATFDVLLNDGAAYLALTAGGSGYIVDDVYEFEVDVDDGTVAVPLSSLTDMNGDPPQFIDAILDINVDDGGSGFTAPPWVRVSDLDNEFGSIDYYEEFTTTLGTDDVVSVDVVAANQRVGYTLYPDVEVTIIKMGASAVPNITASGVVGVTITNAGSGYNAASPPNVIFVNDGTGGTGAAGDAVVTADGRIESVTMSAMGTGYIGAPEVYFHIPNTPYPAMGYVVVNEKGVVVSVELEDGLDGFTLGGGWGYTAPPTVTIDAVLAAVNLGAGATAEAQIDGNGTVTGVTVTNGGADYIPVMNMPTNNVSSGISQGTGFDMWPQGSWVYTLPGKGEVREIRMGTGKREDDTNDCYDNE